MGRITRHVRDEADRGHDVFTARDPVRAISMATQSGIRGEGERFLGEVLGLLHNGDPAIRTAAATALGVIGDERTLTSLKAASEDPDGGVAAAATLARARLGDPSAPHEACERLSARLRDGETDERACAARALGALGLHDAYGPLLDALHDGAPEVREDAAEALGRLGDGHAAQELVQLSFSDPAGGVRSAALGALARLATVAH